MLGAIPPTLVMVNDVAFADEYESLEPLPYGVGLGERVMVQVGANG